MRKFSIFMALTCLLMAFQASATVVPSFTVSSSRICDGQSLVLTNTTIAPPGSHLSFYWYFPMGIPTSSNAQNPGSVTFHGPSAPMVQLQVYDSVADAHYYYEASLFTVLALPTLSVTPGYATLNCASDSVVLTATGSTLTIWTRPSGINDTSTIEVAHVAGLYHVVTIDTNGCRSYTNYVTVDGSAVFTVNLWMGGSSSDTASVCSHTGEIWNMNANLEGSFTWPVSFSWSTGSTSSGWINVITSGVYTVTATDAHGCISRDTMYALLNAYPSTTINVVPVTACVGDTVTLTAAPGCHYSWSTGDSVQSIRMTTSGSRGLTITNAAGCINYTGTWVNFFSNPTVLVMASTYTHLFSGIPDTTWVCSNTIGNVGAWVTSGWSSSFHYLWSSGDTNQNAAIVGTGLYKVTVTTAEGCHGSDSQYIFVHTPPDSTLHPSITGTLCTGNILVLRVPSGATSYLWNTGSTYDSIIITSDDVVNCHIANSFGCYVNTATYVANFYNTPAPTISVGPCVLEVSIVDAGSSYQWYLDTAAISGATGTTYHTFSSGFYHVKETTDMGCIAMAPSEYVSCTTGITELEKGTTEIYPNPFNDHLEIKGFEKNVIVTLTNMFGQEVVQQGGTNIITSQIPSGIYIISIKNSDGNEIRKEKIVKQ